MLACNDSMKCFLAACLVQSEFGDFDEADEVCSNTDYITELNILPPGSDSSLLEQVKKFHRQRQGQAPFESDFALLEKVKQIETYGAAPVEARDGHQGECPRDF